MNCNTCKHWTREYVPDFPNADIQTHVGRCSTVVDVNYWEWIDVAEDKITDGKMGGANIYTHEAFGCVNYEPKQ